MCTVVNSPAIKMERTLSNSKLIYHNTTKELKFYVPPRYCFLDLSDRQADSHTHTGTEKQYTIIYLGAILITTIKFFIAQWAVITGG